MRHTELLRRARERLRQDPPDYCSPVGFVAGGRWMARQLGNDRATASEYWSWGVGKYIVSVLAALTTLVVGRSLGILAVPLAVLAFYLVEVHFLFVFPLLADGVCPVLAKSLRATYRVGLLRAVTTVIPIAVTMLVGLRNWEEPFRGWYTGCMCIIIWYDEEVRGRV